MEKAELYFFTGENDYALERELLRWKQGFSAKHGAENFLELPGKTASLSDLLDAVSVMPFIAEKRFVLIRGLPKIDKDELKAVAENIHPQVVTVFAESKPDKRLGIVKTLSDLADVKEFPSVSPRDLSAWAKTLVKAEGGSITDAAFTLLVETCGSDQWTLESELKKLVSFATNGDVLPAHVEAMAVPSGDQVVWKLTDLIGNRKSEAALAFFNARLERGEDPYGIWVILLNTVKNLTLVWTGLQEGLRDERSIGSAFGIHPFAVRGLIPLARSMTPDRIHDLVNWASDADLALKTGGYHYTAERQGEIVALTERAIMMCR